ncbi:MAG TPA: hypothetical protein VL098_00690 [Flavipsychrobacter sp.]|nr:hypothetical protein [Flavipsychrobacter sp.]
MKTSVIVMDDEYPNEIKKLGLEYFYDKTKWTFYCQYCDERLNLGKEQSTKDAVITFGMLPLIFDEVQVQNDSVEIGFSFYFKGKPVTEQQYNKSMLFSIMYNVEKDTVTYYRESRFFTRVCCNPGQECRSRLIKPLQPEVIKYIYENREKLNRWFRDEAIKQGVIK